MANGSREVILLIDLGLVRPHLEHYIQLQGPQHRKHMKLLEQVQRRAMKIAVRSLEHVSYEERLGQLGLVTLEK